MAAVQGVKLSKGHNRGQGLLLLLVGCCRWDTSVEFRRCAASQRPAPALLQLGCAGICSAIGGGGGQEGIEAESSAHKGGSQHRLLLAAAAAHPLVPAALRC